MKFGPKCKNPYISICIICKNNLQQKKIRKLIFVLIQDFEITFELKFIIESDPDPGISVRSGPGCEKSSCSDLVLVRILGTKIHLKSVATKLSINQSYLKLRPSQIFRKNTKKQSSNMENKKN